MAGLAINGPTFEPKVAHTYVGCDVNLSWPVRDHVLFNMLHTMCRQSCDCHSMVCSNIISGALSEILKSKVILRSMPTDRCSEEARCAFFCCACQTNTTMLLSHLCIACFGMWHAATQGEGVAGPFNHGSMMRAERQHTFKNYYLLLCTIPKNF